MKSSWRGVFPAATTQFASDHTVDIESTLQHLDAMIDAGVHGMIMLGTVGENCSLEESHVAITPLDTALRVGSTMEFAGYDLSLNPGRIQVLRRAASAHLVEPLIEPALEEWSGWRPLTYDDLPMIGPAPSAPNAIIAAGNGMIGIASATATGKLAAQLVTGEKPHLDPAPYSPTRF